MKIFDNTGFTSLTGASQDPIASGCSYIVKTENYSALKCCFQEVRLLNTELTHQKKITYCMAVVQVRLFFKVMLLHILRKKYLLCPEPHFLCFFPSFALGRMEMLSLPQCAWNSCDSVWRHQSGPNIHPTNVLWTRPSPLWLHLFWQCSTSGVGTDFSRIVYYAGWFG